MGVPADAGVPTVPMDADRGIVGFDGVPTCWGADPTLLRLGGRPAARAACAACCRCINCCLCFCIWSSNPLMYATYRPTRYCTGLVVGKEADSDECEGGRGIRSGSGSGFGSFELANNLFHVSLSGGCLIACPVNICRYKSQTMNSHWPHPALS